MKLSILEPLGVEKEKFLNMAEKVLGDRVEITYYDNRVEDSETLIERSKDAEIVVLSNFQYRKDVIEKCPNLKMICVAFTGVDHVDIDYCKDRGITVCNCAGYSTVAVADLVFGLLINIYRNIVECNIVTRKGGTKNGLVGFELEGKKFGVIGTGAIGMRVANIAKAFGCEVYAYSRTVKEGKEIKYVDLNTLLSTCDVISLHVPLNENTKGLINEENIKLMKKSAVLINTARGPVVDSKALSDALKNNIIAGAGIDVFEIEPPIPVDHVLFDAPNLIVTPHVAFATKESMVKRAEIVFDNIDKYINGSSQNVIV
ncbi:2-hydroxyacid dehydrogenase [Clostridium butyricum]|uniref:Glycerate dehydrogenase n=1 Tax=Clostridium butyricum E4 str. BoNT E BL5262 TaxID=632245 RepID=C4ICN6_CLOBU|nr:2-hydroxyacid dehydrogenase [Clostridium butyricum]APF21448.1 D-isomer specific 2-hydroxyacid dehydrogenase, NAD binding domain protein [Clostridium butyricum]EDT73517.1 glycerate dehydrogenase [Clostridium butyricum 5521]EEP56441.1 glycerate dehydrogenase [Clostridium butyricum E4 str. BoNT E BL5262]NFL32687.1 hydroxyacid dehydrogenase [Clostridium butyricum]NFS20074.1 hydroxyacid dehydrogenase [Clostridium butyricum]